MDQQTRNVGLIVPVFVTKHEINAAQSHIKWFILLQ